MTLEVTMQRRTRKDKGETHEYTPHAYPTHCSQIQGGEVMHNNAAPRLNLFYTDCPDYARIPAGCTLNCGYPMAIEWRTHRCPYIEDCPCAHEDSPERAAAIARWQEHAADRIRMVKAAVR